MTALHAQSGMKLLIAMCIALGLAACAARQTTTTEDIAALRFATILEGERVLITPYVLTCNYDDFVSPTADRADGYCAYFLFPLGSSHSLQERINRAKSLISATPGVETAPVPDAKIAAVNSGMPDNSLSPRVLLIPYLSATGPGALKLVP